MSSFFLVIYVLAAVLLSVYSLNYLFTTLLYLTGPRKQERESSPTAASDTDDSRPFCPRVTVQLPIYNELYVVGRLIDAAAALDWPRDRLQIQVLDDSDDETSAAAGRRVGHYRRLGVDITHYRRTERRGFKAGALAYGLREATGDFIAIFDADFVPPRDFLSRAMPAFAADDKLGLVQARWRHLNAEYSPLTRAQAVALDGHFAVEQAARSARNLFMNFNGTAGIWRRACIEAAGGWQEDTLTEDLDLSYRAQLVGWKLRYLPDVSCPAELPPQLQAFKRQQFRWAKGSTQCLVKLGPRVMRAPGLSPLRRFVALLHLSGYVMNPLMVLLLIATVPLIAVDAHLPTVLMYLTFAACGPLALYSMGQRALHRDWLARIAYFPALMLLGTGLSLSGTLAVLEALLRVPGQFRRTPKFGVEKKEDNWDGKRYRLSLGPEAIGEIALACYALIGLALAWRHHSYWTMPFLLLYAGGFICVAALGFWHSRPARSRGPGWAGVPE